MKPAASERITLLARAPELGLSREAFFSRSGATQKGRILEAATHVVAERGYSGATVAQIVAAAGVSRSTFYEHFAGKKECLLASYEIATELVLGLIAEAVAEAIPHGWRAALDAGLNAYFDVVASEPEIVRAQFVELGTIGAEGVRARQKAQEAHTQALLAFAESVRASDPSTPAIDAEEVRVILAGIEERIAQSVATDRVNFDAVRLAVLGVFDRL